MSQTEIFPYLADIAERMEWSCREVLRDVRGVPHLFHRIELEGPRFEERSLEPVVRIGRLAARFVEIAPDGLSARAYFDQPLPESGAITWGYEDGVVYRYPRLFEGAELETLDRKRIPRNVRFPTDRGSLLPSGEEITVE